MESMGKKKARPRRSFTSEFKAEIVELCRRGDRSVGQVAKDFDLTETAVRDWVKQAAWPLGRRGIGPRCAVSSLRGPASLADPAARRRAPMPLRSIGTRQPTLSLTAMCRLHVDGLVAVTVDLGRVHSAVSCFMASLITHSWTGCTQPGPLVRAALQLPRSAERFRRRSAAASARPPLQRRTPPVPLQ